MYPPPEKEKDTQVECKVVLEFLNEMIFPQETIFHKFLFKKGDFDLEIRPISCIVIINNSRIFDDLCAQYLCLKSHLVLLILSFHNNPIQEELLI